jgi:hexokinase
MSQLLQVSENVHKVVDPELVLSDKTLRDFMKTFENEIKKGLKKSTHNSAEIKCFVTYVQDLPNDNERGKFLALDLGGTNFRVLLIHLRAEENYEFQAKIYEIPKAIQVGTGTALFDHIAMCLSDFVKEQNIQDESLPLGFTFSFPCRQIGLTEGILIKWTKGFNCEGVVGENVVELLNAAIKRRDVSG